MDFSDESRYELIDQFEIFCSNHSFPLPKDFWKYDKFIWFYEIDGEIYRGSEMVDHEKITMNGVDASVSVDPETGYHSWKIEKDLVFMHFSGEMKCRIFKYLSSSDWLMGHFGCVPFITLRYFDEEDNHEYNAKIEYDMIPDAQRWLQLSGRYSGLEDTDLKITIYGELDPSLPKRSDDSNES